MSKLESKFQADLKKEIELRLDGSMVLVKPGMYVQGFPDLLILYKNQWAALECKKSMHERYEPNQEWYLETLDRMGIAYMICPENREEILDEICQALGVGK